MRAHTHTPECSRKSCFYAALIHCYSRSQVEAGQLCAVEVIRPVTRLRDSIIFHWDKLHGANAAGEFREKGGETQTGSSGGTAEPLNGGGAPVKAVMLGLV